VFLLCGLSIFGRDPTVLKSMFRNPKSGASANFRRAGASIFDVRFPVAGRVTGSLWRESG
jgi:hypothetical protein